MSNEPEPQDEAGELRNLLVKELVNQRAIGSQTVREAFEEVPRHLFVPRVDLATAYSNRPIFIRWDEGIPISSSSEPTMMAIMVEQLNLEPGSRVLEIGAGTGYNAAILAHVVGETGSVITMDIDQDIVDEAAGNLAKTGYGNVKAICGDGFEGFPGDLPYDRITVTVGAYDISPHWVDQLVEGRWSDSGPAVVQGMFPVCSLGKARGWTQEPVCEPLYIYPDPRRIATNRRIFPHR